jgi:DNA repair exonuclease SbcCD ATPase subunit
MSRRGDVLEVSTDRKQEKIDELQKEVTTLNAKVQELNESKTKKALDEEQTALKQATDEIARQNGVVGNKMSQIEGLKKDLATKDSELADMNQTLKNQKAKTDIDELEIKKLQDLHQTIQEEIEKLKTQVGGATQLQKENEELLAKVLALEFERDTQQTEIEVFKQAGNNDELKKQIDEIQKKIDEKNSQLQGLVDNVNANFDENIKIIEGNNATIQELRQKIQQKEIDKNKQILEMNQNIEQLQKTIAGLETEKKDNNVHYIQTTEQQKRKIEELKGHLDTAELKTIKQCNEKIAEQVKVITDLGETIKGLNDTLE